MRIGFKDHEEQTPLDNVRIIERRIEWLEERIKEAKRKHYSPKFDVSERDALLWALDTIKQWIDIPNVDDDLKDF
jgi:hypothetical protein